MQLTPIALRVAFLVACSTSTTFASAPPLQWQNERISTSTTGVPGDGHSQDASLSADGRFVAFASAADDLIAGDAGLWDVFLHDRLSRSTVRISISSDGTPANGPSLSPSISNDGRFVAFQSAATNLGAAVAPGTQMIFVRNLEDRLTTPVTFGLGGAVPNGSCIAASMSRDGARIAFTSFATNLVPGDTNGTWDCFVVERQSLAIVRASVSSSGQQGNGTSTHPVALSDDGRYVTFASYASNLAAGNPGAGLDVFVRDIDLGVTTHASGPALSMDFDAYIPTISGDGRHVAYRADSQRFDAVAPAAWRIYVVDRVTGVTENADVDSNGVPSNGFATQPVLTPDARYVTFASDATNLGAGDPGGVLLAYRRDRLSGVTECMSYDATGQFPDNSCGAVDISDDGRVVVVESDARDLVTPPETTNRTDVYVMERAPLAVASYCTAKTNSLGCVPEVSALGVPSASSAAPYWVGARNVISHRSGLGFFGFASANVPFQGGRLCVQPPLTRLPLEDSGGASAQIDCTGLLAYDFNAIVRSGSYPSLTVGTLVHVQFWYRDPASASTTGLSDALQFTIQN